MTKRLRALLAKKDEHVKSARALTDLAEKETREFTAEEQTALDGHLKSIEAVKADIDREQALIEAERSAAAIPHIVVEENIEKDPKRGFKHFGDFAHAVWSAGVHNGADLDNRLAIIAAAPSTFGSEGVGADGGFLVPAEFSQEIFAHSLEQDALLPLTDNDEIGGNSMVYPKDETTPWGTDGIRAYWENEAGAATATKPKLGTTMLRLHKLLALVPMTDELLADSAVAGNFVMGGMSRSIRWKTNDALVNGNGQGQPLGILNAGALVSVAKEGSQAADTVKIENVSKIFARMPAESVLRSRWLINNNVLPQLITMVLSQQSIWTVPGRLADAPAGLLLARPIMMSQHCKTLGDKGDIYFVDWGMYRTITKRGGIETATSMHLYFDAGATAFRATFRIDGQPKIGASITPANGADNLSPFVTLDERA